MSQDSYETHSSVPNPLISGSVVSGTQVEEWSEIDLRNLRRRPTHHHKGEDIQIELEPPKKRLLQSDLDSIKLTITIAFTSTAVNRFTPIADLVNIHLANEEVLDYITSQCLEELDRLYVWQREEAIESMPGNVRIRLFPES